MDALIAVLPVSCGVGRTFIFEAAIVRSDNSVIFAQNVPGQVHRCPTFTIITAFCPLHKSDHPLVQKFFFIITKHIPLVKNWEIKTPVKRNLHMPSKTADSNV